MGLALIITLLIIGGIEQNPGPDCADEEQVPGPSFISATPMDIMESLRLTQRQLDKMENDISHLTSLVQMILCATKQVTGTSDQTYTHMSMSNALNNTDESVQEAQMENNPSPSSQRHSDENKTEWTSPIQVKNVAETIVIGGINVSRLRDALRDKTNLERNVKFVTAFNKNIWDLIPGCIRKIRRSKLNVVLHTGADLVLKHTPDFVLECIASQIDLAKREPKTRRVFVCSVEERVDAGYHVFETARTVNSELSHLCEAFGATFIDLRPGLSECKFGGLNKTGLLYTFKASKILAEMIANKSDAFLEQTKMNTGIAKTQVGGGRHSKY